MVYGKYIIIFIVMESIKKHPRAPRKSSNGLQIISIQFKMAPLYINKREAGAEISISRSASAVQTGFLIAIIH